MHMLVRAAAIVALLLSGSYQAIAQQSPTPAKALSPGSLVWQAVLRAEDGRTFVTDGGLVIDAAIALPSTLPEREVPAGILQRYFNAPKTQEYGFEDLDANGSKAYTAPNGVNVNAAYIDFLRRVLPSTARLSFGGPTDPVIIVSEGKTVGAFMPLAR